MERKGEFPAMINGNGDAPEMITAKSKTSNPEDRMYG
jgi:hypothetical protein